MQRPVPATFSKAKSRSRNQRRNRRRRKSTRHPLHSAHKPSAVPHTTNPVASKLWLQTYENIVRWQLEHQASYWRNVAEKLRTENNELRRRLQIEEGADDESPHPEEDYYLTSSEESGEEIIVDEGYLDFMEVTRKHQESVKQMKMECKGQESI